MDQVVGRFFSRIHFGMSECWLWKGAKKKDGYGIFNAYGEELAHRASWVMHNGKIPEGLCVMHTCDVPECVYPEHLKLGTHADNMADMAAKGRRKGINTGDCNGRCRIKDAELKTVRSRYAGGETITLLAKCYGVGTSTIYRIVTGERK